MQITFYGAAQTVTGSQHLFEANGHKLLIDCGMYQGRRQEAVLRNTTFKFNPTEVDAVILTHAHIDHIGNLPNLGKFGFKGPVYATPATAHLAEFLLLDSARIQESDAAYLNRKRNRGKDPAVVPLYTEADARQVLSLLRPIPYDQEFQPVPGVTARLVDAGHILGSAAAVLDVDEGGRQKRVWFSGDIGRPYLPLLRDPVLPERADYLVMEATYGNKAHRHPEQAYVELREVVGRTIARGGKVIIPAFAVGRTQELVYSLHQMFDRGELPVVPVYVDSPLAVNVSDVFRLHTDLFDAETQAFMSQDKRHAALSFERLVYTRSVEESKALNERREPAIIISASGMAETGRILHHLKNNIEDPRNTVLIVSWQAPHTLGRRLADREKQIKIFGEVYERQAEVATIGGLSAHAGQDGLLAYANASRDTLKGIFLVHAEPPAAQTLMARLDWVPTGYPETGDCVELE